MAARSHSRIRALIVITISVLVPFAPTQRLKTVLAQSGAPVLISQETSTRAIAFDSVTQQQQTFSTTAAVEFGSDKQTRVMLFAMNFNLQPGDTVADVSVDAEDAAHNSYHLPVEFIGSVPDQSWATSVVVRLSDALNDAGDVLIGVNYSRGCEQPCSDCHWSYRRWLHPMIGAHPMTFSASHPPSPAPNATAGNLDIGEVQTVISQAVSDRRLR